MRRPPVLLLCGLLGLFLAGCKSCEPVENALRATEESLRETREGLARQGAYTAALEQELRILRGAPFLPPGSPGQPVAVYPVRSFVLGRQTGGHASPTGLADDGLQVVLEPRNAEGNAIQVPGEAVVQVLEITAEGHKRLLSSWLVGKDHVKSSWRNGLLSQGYNIILPWRVLPSTEKLRVVASFKLEDGRVFEAEKDVTVRLPKGAPSLTGTAPPVVVQPGPSQPGPVLPEPKPEPKPPVVEPPIPTLPEPKVEPEPIKEPPLEKKGPPAAVPDGPSLGWRSVPRLDEAIRPAAEIGPPRP